ncbi:MAG: family peptidase [Sphingobacteriaceae bacterium]|nr:family peptidase [Sphingobacteriaceae bacterium]
MRTRTRKNLIVAACYAGVFTLGMFFGPKFSKENASTKNGSFLTSDEQAEKVNKVLQIISDKYVDPIKVDSLQNLAIQDILKKLDPHSAYLPPADAQIMHDDLEGNYNGIGIEYYLLKDTLVVTSVTPTGPADKAGLKRGDAVLKINGQNIAGAGITNRKIVELIRGTRGSKLQLFAKRGGDLKTFDVVRDKITVSSIDVAYMLNPQTGYIKISKFGGKTDEDFIASLTSLQHKGMKNLVLDLRNNGGGYLNAATALADQFLPDKKLIVYTEGKHEPRTDYLATADGQFEHGGLVVLIDENTASASEILVGAIQDLERGTVIGRRSFGKGLVQEQFDFGDGSAMNLTIARYFTPLGRSIQRSYKHGSDAYFQEVGNRFKDGEVNNSTGKYADSLYNKEKVFKTVSGKVMYGGGGIMPDIYVPIDTTGNTGFYYELSGKGVLNDFVFSSLLKNMTLPKSLNSLVKNFRLSDEQYGSLLAIAKGRNIKVTDGEALNSRSVIDTELKALIARYYYGDEGYYRVINSNDKALAKSLQVFDAEKSAGLISKK